MGAYEENAGVFILGKFHNELLHLTAFRIFCGQSLYVPPHTIHSNDYQRGRWRTYLENSEDIDICALVQKNDPRQNICLKFECAITRKRMSRYELDVITEIND